ncbi:MAG TPA: DUF6064 family protein [Gemmatimonadaceae bacterium]|nr:DUF6064 family protein [Gemmatimonadaceae bacterium]
MLPFTREQFFTVFSDYNEAVWPAQAVLYVAALMAVGLAFRGTRSASRTVFAVLALLWGWMGIVYHAGFFSAINPPARIFAGAFVVQAAVFVYLAASGKAVAIAPRRDIAGLMGGVLIVTGLIVYPILSVIGGHRYPAQPTFGLPCPTTIYTLGLLLWSHGMPRYATVVPVLWVLPATIAAVQLGVREDLLLGASLVVCAVVFASRFASHEESDPTLSEV